MAIRKVSIFDMDGTIVDSNHRYRTIKTDQGEKIDLQFWRDNQHLAMLDSLLPLAQQYKQDLENPECYVIIATARVMNDPDWTFVREVLGTPDHFISREEGDNTSGGLLKINGLAKFFNLKPFLNAKGNITFYEDNATYLKTVCDRFGIRGVYVPSNQGH